MHLSSELSGTYESAQLAARQSPVPVTAVDSRQLGMATGFAVVAAAEVLAAGGNAAEAAEEVRRRTAATTSLFYVDTLEYLRRGGRIGAAAALLGSALSVKPLLALENGRIGMREKVRTAARALNRLEELAAAAADELAGRRRGRAPGQPGARRDPGRPPAGPAGRRTSRTGPWSWARSARSSARMSDRAWWR